MGKLTLPEGLVIALVILPVLFHVSKSSSSSKQVANVVVGTAAVTVLRVRTVTVIGPETVDSPRVYSS